MKKLVLALMLTTCGLANAGFNGLTWHSRANCGGNNESITWDYTRDWVLATLSQHYKNGVFQHNINADGGWKKTWRSAAVHWGEGLSGWWVRGDHMMSQNNQEYILGQTSVTDCSIYDGWWDVNR